MSSWSISTHVCPSEISDAFQECYKLPKPGSSKGDFRPSAGEGSVVTENIYTFITLKENLQILNLKMKKMKLVVFTILLSLCLSGTAVAQEVKIGYANIELILSLMPETQAMQTQLQTFQQRLGEQLQAKENYAQAKLAEYHDKQQGGSTEAELKPLEDELYRLDNEIRQFASQSEEKLMNKRQSLMEPITEKLQANIDGLAREQGFTYILNAVDGSGLSIVLYGPEQSNVTVQLARRLGIAIPEGN